MSSSTELINCYNSNTRTTSSVSLWKSSIVFHVKSGVSSWWILQDIKEIVKARLSKLSKEATYPSLLLSLKFLNHTWFPSPTPDLYEVTPSSPCSQSSAFLLHWLTAESLQVHSLLPFLCLPPSLTSIRVSAPRGKTTRVWFGRVSSNQVSLVQF